MGYADALLILIALTALLHFTYANVPFTHDFNAGQHGWTIGHDNWQWTVHPKYPNTRHITSFYSTGNYLWTEKTLNGRPGPSNMLQYEYVMGVTRDTKLHFSYWFYSREVDCGFLAVYVNEGHDQLFTNKFADKNSTDWEELVIDCQHDTCCQYYPCDLRLSIMGSVGCSDGSGFIAIRSVSGTVTTAATFWPMVIENQQLIIIMAILIIIIGAVIINVRNRKRDQAIAVDTEKLCPQTIEAKAL